MPDIQISISKSLSEIKPAGNGKDEWGRKAGIATLYTAEAIGAPAEPLPLLEASCSIMHFFFSIAFLQGEFKTFVIDF